MSFSLSLPTLQNWSCHSCGNCCRQHLVNITESERQRILDQNWTAADNVPEGKAAFRKTTSGYSIVHQPDGACVFLDETNRCKIHARFGEASKPLSCRAYPFVFSPNGPKSVAISVRFDCPSTTANRGRPVVQQRKDLQGLCGEAIPADKTLKPPGLSNREQLDWDDTMRVVARLGEFVCDRSERTLPIRLVHALFVSGMLARATFDKIRGGRIDELIDTLITCAPLETVASMADVKEPASLARTQFRLTVAQYAVQDTSTRSGLGYRIGKAIAGFRFTRGKGLTPAMGSGLNQVPFVDLEQPAQADTPEINELLERFFRVKISGMAFCGLACYGMNVIEGFHNLALLYPVIMYIARWVARSRGGDRLARADVERSLMFIDHHYARSPVMGWANFRNRVRRLAEGDEISKLIGWYAR